MMKNGRHCFCCVYLHHRNNSCLLQPMHSCSINCVITVSLQVGLAVQFKLQTSSLIQLQFDPHARLQVPQTHARLAVIIFLHCTPRSAVQQPMCTRSARDGCCSQNSSFATTSITSTASLCYSVIAQPQLPPSSKTNLSSLALLLQGGVAAMSNCEDMVGPLQRLPSAQTPRTSNTASSTRRVHGLRAL